MTLQIPNRSRRGRAASPHAAPMNAPGSMSRPERVADSPRPFWMKRGRMTPEPMSTDSMRATSTTAVRNCRLASVPTASRGRSRRSWRPANSAMTAIPAPMRPSGAVVSAACGCDRTPCASSTMTIGYARLCVGPRRGWARSLARSSIRDIDVPSSYETRSTSAPGNGRTRHLLQRGGCGRPPSDEQLATLADAPGDCKRTAPGRRGAAPTSGSTPAPKASRVRRGSRRPCPP